jgi:hypothetical protein
MQPSGKFAMVGTPRCGVRAQNFGVAALGRAPVAARGKEEKTNSPLAILVHWFDSVLRVE